MQLIRTFEEIDRPWVAAVLDGAGLPGAAVSAVSVEDIGGDGRGFLSGVARVHISYGDGQAAGPESVIVKLPTVLEANLDLGLSMNAYEREMRFYRDIAGSSPIRVPACFLAEMDRESRTALIAIEDAKAWIAGDQVYGLSRDDAEATISAIAAFHARWWGDPALAQLDWVPDRLLDVEGPFAENWPAFVEEYSHFLTAEGRRIGDALAASGPAMARAVDDAPRTLVHGDLRADNLMFDGPAPGDRVMVLDWQLMTKSLAAFDIARLICGSLETALPRAEYRKLVGLWHAGLRAGGVEDYGEAEAWRDFRVGILQALYFPVCFHGLVSHEGARAVRFLEAQIHRFFRAAEECQALAGLEGG